MNILRTSLALLAALVLLAPSACSSGRSSAPTDGEPDVSSGDATEDADVPWDGGADAGAEIDAAPIRDVGPQDTGEDTDGDAPMATPQFTRAAARPNASTLPATLASCPIIRENRCVDGAVETCALWDANTDDWATDVPPMTEQAYVFDRYFDLYHQANGQSMDVHFTGPVPAGTPESEWSKPEYFQRYDGYGDTSGWTGTALWGAAARYRATGTGSDYQRMLDKLEAFSFLFEVTGVPGIVARSHWAMLPDGAPRPVGHWRKAVAEYHPGDGTGHHFTFPIAEELHDRLPAYYTDGIEIGGENYETAPRFMSDASRDMYVRSLPGALLALDLLGEGEREERLRTTLGNELTCTFARMKKGRVSNLQQNTQIRDAVVEWFAGAGLSLEEGDLDFSEIDTIIFYALEQPHPLHGDAFDASCPDGPPMEVDPALDLDAADPAFLFQLIALADREQHGSEVPIAFSMHVSIRAGDALFITQWALTAHYLTGDERYLEFVANLMEEIPYERVMDTLGAFQLPKYCAPHFAPSLTYPSLYNVLTRVDPAQAPRFWEMLSRVAVTEGRDKEYGRREDAFWGILYNGMVDEWMDPQKDAYVQHYVELLSTYGMNADDKLEPDRAYPRNFVDPPDPTVPLEEIGPGDEEWALCEEPVVILGVEVPAAGIDGVPIRSVEPLPLDKRIGGTMLWQMDPWMVEREYGGVGMDEQWPMLGLFVPYWIGRADGVIDEGEGLALAWRPTGGTCP